MTRVRREGAVGKGEFWDWGQLIHTLRPQGRGTFADLSPSPYLFQDGHDVHAEAGACEYPSLAQHLAAQTSWRSLRRQPFPVPDAGLTPPLPPHMLLAYPPPTFVIFSKLWLSEWRHMCVLQVLLQHSSMQLPKEIPGGTLRDRYGDPYFLWEEGAQEIWGQG